MSIQNERELRDRLAGLLDGVEPHPAPVASVVRRGKGIRMRRWISVAAGAAVIVAGAALLPGLFQQSRIAPAQRTQYRVTVHPAGKHASASLIAYGTVNGRKWRATATGSAKSVAVRLCGGSYITLTAPGPIGSTGVTAFSGLNNGTGTDWCMASEVSRGVSMISMALDNGATVELQPVSYRGLALIAFALPPHARILRLTAYEGGRVVAYAIPFNGPSWPTVEAWLRPGQQAPAVATARLPRALAGPGRWAASVAAGPWGTCLVILVVHGSDSSCGPSQPQHQLVSLASGSGDGPTIVGTRADVAYVVLTMKNGSTVKVTVARVAGTGYFAIGAIRQPALLRWTAFSAAGRDLGGGPGVPGATRPT